MVRAGRNGEREQAALDEGLLIAGWEEVGDLSGATSKIEIREVVEKTYPDASPARIANWTGQLWRMIAVGEEPEKGDPSTSRDDPDDNEPGNSSTLAPRIGVIESANIGKVVTVRPSDDIAVAVTKMIAHGYSQLAVVEGSGEEMQLRGAITWASIGTASVTARPKRVADAMFRVRAVHNRDFLLPLLDEIYHNEFLFVRSDDSPLTGIVTAADLTKRFGQTTRPLVLIEEAERRLREIVSEVFTDEDFRAAGVRYSPSSGTPPTIGNYVHLLNDLKMWLKLGWPIDHEFFKEQLERLRVARNDFMHFNPDPLSDGQLHALEGFVRVLRAAHSRD